VFSYVRALVLLIFLLYMAIIYESTSLALLGFTGAVLLVCSFFYLLAAAKGVKGSITVPICIAESGRPFFVQVEAANRFPLPLAKVRTVIRFGERADRHLKKQIVVLMPQKNSAVQHRSGGRKRHAAQTVDRPGKQGRLCDECSVTIDSPGNYVFSITRLRIYDLTGCFYLTKKCRAQAQAIVLPEPEAVPVILGERVYNFFGDADAFDDLRPGYDPSETFDVREFRDGDRLQNVHWKLSAKSDDLIVKENSLPKACPVVCFFTPPRTERKRLLTMIASISYSLMDAGCPHFAVWHSAGQKDIIRTRVDDEESYYRFLTAFLQDASYDAPQKLSEEYRRKYRGETWLHEIAVGADLRLTLDQSAVLSGKDEMPELILN
jgi:hypothetical protein